jgi:squalene-hopene/tetraprenyl-beta-curcumene cyclase
VTQPKTLEGAVTRSQQYLLSIQKDEGYWVGELLVDATLVADTICFHHWNESVDPAWQQKGVNHLFSKQLPDGGWNIYHGGPAEVNATIKCYLALKLAGLPHRSPHAASPRNGPPPRRRAADEHLLQALPRPARSGGVAPRPHHPLRDPAHREVVPRQFLGDEQLVPRHDRPARHHQPLPPHPERRRLLDELYPNGKWELDETPAPALLRFQPAQLFLWLDRLHKLAEWFQRHGLHPFRAAALKRARNGCSNVSKVPTGWRHLPRDAQLAHRHASALGYSKDHPEVLRAWLNSKSCSTKKPTPSASNPASPRSGTPPSSPSASANPAFPDHPALVKACPWIMDREIRFRGDWYHKNPVDVEPSGWVFEYNNKWNPDVDDTAMVLLALRQMPTKTPLRRDACFRRGYNWMLTFQCRDGGWAAFDKDCTKSILEKVPFADHNAMLDPECVDITARILEVMGLEGVGLDHPQVNAPSTTSVVPRNPTARSSALGGELHLRHLAGPARLKAIGYDMSEPWLLRARDWLESVQHADGGWGERCNTYDDPVFKGQGPSTASQTAWATMGLCAFDEPDRPSLKRGIEYLVNTQNDDGSWTEDEVRHRHRASPTVFYLKYDMYRNAWPLLASGPGPRADLPRLRRRSSVRPAASRACSDSAATPSTPPNVSQPSSPPPARPCGRRLPALGDPRRKRSLSPRERVRVRAARDASRFTVHAPSTRSPSPPPSPGRESPINRYPVPCTVSRCRGCDGSSSTFARKPPHVRVHRARRRERRCIPRSRPGTAPASPPRPAPLPASAASRILSASGATSRPHAAQSGE